MKLLSLDPSTTRTGYAVLTKHDRGPHLIESGVLEPHVANRKKKLVPALVRVADMCEDLDSLVREHGITCAVVETASPSPFATKSDQKRKANLLTYAMGVGMILRETQRILGRGLVWEVSAGKWARGKKQDRARRVAMIFPSYVIAQDPDFDAADAIGLGMWWMHDQRRSWR